MRELQTSASQLLDSSSSGGRKRGGREAMARSWDTFLQKRGAIKEEETSSFFEEGSSGRGRKRRPANDEGWKSYYEEGAEIRSVSGERRSTSSDSFDRPRRSSSARSREREGDDHRYIESSSVLPYQTDNRQTRDFRLRNRIYDDERIQVKSQALNKKAQLSEYRENDMHGFKEGSRQRESRGSSSRPSHEGTRVERSVDRSRPGGVDELQASRSASELKRVVETWLGSGEASPTMPVLAVKRLNELRASKAEQVEILDLLVPKILGQIESQSKLREATDLPSAQGNKDARWKKDGAGGFDWLVSYALFHIVKMGHYDSEHVRALISAITKDDFRMIQDLSSRSLPQVMWCFAKIKHQGTLPEFQGGIDALTRSLMSACIKLLEDGQSHPLFLSNAAWSLGSLGVKGELSERVARMLSSSARTEMSSLLSSFLPSSRSSENEQQQTGQFHEVSLATFCHGLSQMNHYDAGTMKMAGDLMSDLYERKKIQDLRPLASFLFACGTLIHYDAPLMRRLSTIVIDALSIKEAQYAPVSINHIIWAFSVLKYYDPQLVKSVAEWTTVNVGRFSNIRKDPNLSLVCWSLMNLGVEDESSRRLVEVTSKKVLEEAAAEGEPEGEEKLSDTVRLFHHLANYAHSLLILAPDRTDLMAKCIELCSPLLQKIKDEGIIDELLAAVRESRDPRERARLDARNEKHIVETIPEHGMLTVDSHHGPFIACRSLWSIHMELVDRGMADSGLKSWQLDALREMWASSPTRISPYQQDVFSTIESMEIPGNGSKPRSEVLSDDEMFSIDIVIYGHPKWGKVAIEVDGPFHFFSNLPDVHHGKAKLRNRFLARRVDKLISINLDTEWKKIPDQAGKKGFISQLLA